MFLDVVMGPSVSDLGLDGPGVVVLLLVAELLIAAAVVAVVILRKSKKKQTDTDTIPNPGDETI